MELILATRNAHKLREVSRLLAPFGLSVAPLPQSVELPPEDGDSFEANALPKARAAAAALGLPVIADDSGIESAALHGRPGVRSARFAGEHATDAGLDPAADAGSERVFFGDCRGRLAAAPAGSAGFGYDPAFIPSDRTDN